MSAIKFTYKDNHVILSFGADNAKLNVLSTEVLLELEEHIDKAASLPEATLLLITSSKENCFIAGADINEIKSLDDEEKTMQVLEKAHAIFAKLENLSIPTVAYIDGVCLGGGLELALCCDYRIATDNSKTKLGLPEVSLGILPGFGGTQRLPKVVGLQESLKMILTGAPISSKKALKIGLINTIIPIGYENFKLDPFLDDVVAGRVKNEHADSLLERFSPGRTLIFNTARKDLLKKTKGHYPAPLSALDVIEQTVDSSLEVGLNIEKEAFCKLAVSEISKNLIGLFFNNEMLKKEWGSDGEVASVSQVAVVGAGVMGGGIAWLFSKIDIAVRMKDISWEQIGVGMVQINKIYAGYKKRHRMGRLEIESKTSLVSYTLDYSGFKKCDFVVEAVVENMDLKKKIFAQIEENVKEGTILATNTSSLSVTEMATALKNPENLVGMHFFNPVNRMPLVEVIAGEKTSASAIATTVALAKKAGKTAVVVADCPGFLVNRILIPYMNEAAHMLDAGADFEQIDQVIEHFGMPMGPFVLADEVGLDVGYKVAKILEDGYGERMKVAKVLDVAYNEHGLLGKKSEEGFYLHDESERERNHRIEGMVDSELTQSDESLIIDRLILMMVNEASKCLEESVVANVSSLDMAMIMGTGFPPFRGGLLKYADSYGIQNIVDKLTQFESEVGMRFKPSTLLVQMAADKQTFYKGV
jgi:3-hydroxyacyl-CoA dehydrogenase / enoyl-CoA hydratase / 3-hydroxybutyryl-CoA epimerase